MFTKHAKARSKKRGISRESICAVLDYGVGTSTIGAALSYEIPENALQEIISSLLKNALYMLTLYI